MKIGAWIRQLSEFLRDKPSPSVADTTMAWYDYLAAIRSTQGNLSNALSFAATLMAKEYLQGGFPLAVF